MLVVMMLFGLDWVATVPPTAVLSTRIFGEIAGVVVFAWAFAFHMIGAAVAALLSGLDSRHHGDYLRMAIAGCLALMAAIASKALPRHFAEQAKARLPVLTYLGGNNHWQVKLTICALISAHF